jgi:lysophospholipase L1-like esterase
MKPRQLQRLTAPLAALLALSTAARPAEAPVRPAADVAVPRTDENSRQAHADLLAKRGKGRIDLYFVGDSITRRWGAAEPRYRLLLEHWQKSFHGWNAADFAWGGDTTGNILWRLDNGELDGVNPRVIVVMAGTNNLARPVADAEAMASEIARGLEAILRRCQPLAPQACIVLSGRGSDELAMPAAGESKGILFVAVFPTG